MMSERVPMLVPLDQTRALVAGVVGFGKVRIAAAQRFELVDKEAHCGVSPGRLGRLHFVACGIYDADELAGQGPQVASVLDLQGDAEAIVGAPGHGVVLSTETRLQP